MKISSFQLKVMIITSIVILLPVIFGLLKWNALPDQVAIHFQLSGQADGWASKGFAVVGFPLIMLAVHALVFFLTGRFGTKPELSNVAYAVVMAIIPAAAIIGSVFIYSNALK